MKKSKHTDEPIAFALKKAEAGTPVVEKIRWMAIWDQTFCLRNNFYGGLGAGELLCLNLLYN